MLKVSLKEELSSQKKAELNELSQSNALKEVKLLMEGDAAEDMRIARGLGTNHSLIIAQDSLGTKLELEKLENGYDGNVFTLEQIKNLAIKYNLRFLNSHYFSGNMDVNVISKIKEFSLKTNTNISNATLDRKFYILAPEQLFSLEKVKVLRKRELDPVIFYQIDDFHYKLIHKWGVDFSAFRLISGVKWSGYWGYVFISTFELLPIVTLLITIFSPSTFKYQYPFIYFIIIPFLSFVISIIKSTKFTDEGIADERFFSPSKWNSTKKLTR